MVNPNEADKSPLESTDLLLNHTNNESITIGLSNSNEQKTSVKFAEVGVQTEISITDGLSSSKSDSATEISTECEISESSGSGIERIQVDAVHPIFEGCRNRRKTVGTSTTEDQLDLYYCSPCKTYLIASLIVLVDHFNKSYHEAVEFCVYCRGPVYVYLHNNDQKLYHKCLHDDLDSSCDSTSAANNNNVINVTKRLGN